MLSFWIFINCLTLVAYGHGENAVLKDAEDAFGDISTSNVSLHYLIKFNMRKSLDLEMDGCYLQVGRKESLQKCGFNATAKTIFVIHGWTMSGLFEGWMTELVSAVIQRETEANVVFVDWISMARQLYPDAVNHTKRVGLSIADMLNWLQDEHQLPLSNVHLIGYSLGAHVAGYVGKNVQGTLGRITGVSPMRSSMLAWLLFITSLQAIPAGGSSCLDHRVTTSSSSGAAPIVDAKLFTRRRFRSPRVLFSAQPPDAAPPGVGAGAEPPARSPGGRTRRVAAGAGQHRGVFSVCDSTSVWVVNKTRATDISGHEVTVLPNVNVNNVNKKQYFFETSCLGSGGGGRGGGAGVGVSSCLGIDARHWNSYCTNSHTFVRALTTYRNLVAWRHIRINVACECVVSRKSWSQS